VSRQPSESLIPDEARALIGEPLAEPVTATVTAAASQRFALAADDLNPIYFDEVAAREAGYEGIVVPPTFLGWALGAFRPITELRPDGLYKSGGRRINLNVARVMFGGDEWDFLEPIYAGDTITAVTRLKSLEQKEGGSGPFVLQSTETTYTNQHGRVVARARGLSIAR
jgi:acyl dehydratase